MGKNHYMRLAVLTLLACAALFVWTAALAQSPATQPALMLAVLDVGQGDAIYIESPSGVQVLIDGGSDSSVLRELPSVMPALDRSIDAVIATHPDADHIGGLVDVFARYEVNAFIEPGVSKDTATYRALETVVEESGADHRIARRGMTLDLGDGAMLTILYPDRDVSGVDANDASIVARLEFGSSSAMLMGDAPKYVENIVAQENGDSLQSDVLKVGHHGSRTSTGESFLQVVSPELAVISAGRDNRYGHPHTEVLQTLARFSVGVLQTAQEGTIVLRSFGGEFERVK